MSADATVRIYLCDDSAAYLMLVRDWLKDHPDLELVGTALSVDEAIGPLRELTPDVVVTDTFAPLGDVALLSELREAAPQAKLILNTGYNADMLSDEVSGAVDAVVTKATDDVPLVDAVRRLAGA